MNTTDSLNRLFNTHREGLAIRRNRPEDYLPLVIDHFDAIHEGHLDRVPAPLCVQLQVTSRCPTSCRMCQHWREKRAEMPTENWQAILEDLAAFKVRAVIFSGGEPLERDDIADLLRSAAREKLRIGLLTSGSGMMVDRTPASREDVVRAIAETADWVSVSIDGTIIEDKVVRNPRNSDRHEVLKQLRTKLKEFNPSLHVSATVTLQKANIGMDLQRAAEYIHDYIGITQVNFKLATGARDALKVKPDYLLDENEVQNLRMFLANNFLPHEGGNNLLYLHRIFLQKVFDARDVSDGVPVRSFYEREALRCFTPFLFSLIDCDGSVYPCCHLYRDNHGMDPETYKYRRKHKMGNVVQSKFAEVWNGRKYVKERRLLKRIQPKGDFVPCGECTRHCQHNLALTRAYELLNEDALEELRRKTGHEPVWF